MLSSLGLSSYDIALLIFCPAGAVVGSFAQAIVQTIDLDGPPRDESKMGWASENLQELRRAWLGLRMMLGGILGIVIGLYFVGAIQENVSTLAKIVALAILAGYAAPKVWVTQERIVSAKIERLVRSGEADHNSEQHADKRSAVEDGSHPREVSNS